MNLFRKNKKDEGEGSSSPVVSEKTKSSASFLKKTVSKIGRGFGKNSVEDLATKPMSNAEYLGEIYKLMVKNHDDIKIERQQQFNRKEEEDFEEQKRHSEIIKALTLRRKPKRVVRREKKVVPSAPSTPGAPSLPTKPPSPPDKTKDAVDKLRKKEAEEAAAKAKKEAEEAARKQAEEAARKQAEAKARKEAEEAAAKARKKAEEEAADAAAKARKKAEAEAADKAKKKAEEESADAAAKARKKAEEEAADKARKKAEEEAEAKARKKAEEEAEAKARKKAEEEAEAKARKKAEEEAEAKARKKAEEEAAEAAKKKETADKLKREEEEAARKAEEAKKKAERVEPEVPKPPTAKPTKDKKKEKPTATEEKKLGKLSKKYESGTFSKPAGVIGYDSTGGTSYGAYQISSPTMAGFLTFLESSGEDDMVKRLKAVLPADTGSTSGKFPDEWQKIADEDPEGFLKLQHDFIEKTKYEPAIEKLKGVTGYDIEKQSSTIKDVFWSTVVQHGPGGYQYKDGKIRKDKAGNPLYSGALDIFRGAIVKAKADAKAAAKKANTEYDPDAPIDDAAIIENVYTERPRRFESSSEEVKKSVQKRFINEKGTALEMLDEENKALKKKMEEEKQKSSNNTNTDVLATILFPKSTFPVNDRPIHDKNAS
jgi:hypothetical protein